MNFKKILCLLLSICLLLSLAACGGNNDSNNGNEETQAATDETTSENLAVYISLSHTTESGEFYYLTAYDCEDGTAYLEYVGQEKKIGTLDVSVLAELTRKLEESGLLGLDGKQEWGEGSAGGSMFITYADDTGVMADFGGQIPAEFTSGYEAMDACFRELMAEIPVYVPAVQVIGDMDPEELAALEQILNNSGMSNLDTLAVQSIPMDEFFPMTAGLSDAEGILSGSSCSAMMMTTAYSVTVVTLEDASSTEAVCADFEASLDWRKWVCVAPTNALIAHKDGMVLCMMGSDELYRLTAASIANAGWTEYKALENPDM